MICIHKKQDGIWLEFTNPEGKLSGMLNLNECFNRVDGLAARAMRDAVEAMELGYREELGFKMTPEPSLPTAKAPAPAPLSGTQPPPPFKVEKSGGPVSYYLVDVDNPNQGAVAYQAECGDIIEALNMTFNEGCAFKAIWRTASARTLNRVKADNSPKYDAEKVIFYGKRMLATIIGEKV
mgnify:CR=1 FL=1